MTNAYVYLAIAEEALDTMRKCSKKNRRPKPNGEPGFIIKYDPTQKSFKNALIAIVFAANCLENIFYSEGVKIWGKDKYEREIDNKTYEQKLQKFEITDGKLHYAATRLRITRKEIVHAKSTNDLRVAQDEAIAAVSFVKEVVNILQKAQS